MPRAGSPRIPWALPSRESARRKQVWVLKATGRPPAAGWDAEAESGQARLLGLPSHLFHVLRCHLKCHLKRKALFLEQNHSKNHCLEIDALVEKAASPLPLRHFEKTHTQTSSQLMKPRPTSSPAICHAGDNNNKMGITRVFGS